MEKNNKYIINGWAFFDWANSAYALVITVAIFPSYFISMTNETVTFLGLEMANSTLYAWSLSCAYLILALFSPLLSGIADYGGRKKFFMRMFTTIGSLACIALYFFHGMSTLWIGVFGFMLATIGFAGSIVFYNAYLPEISTEDQYDRVSARGFSFGYIGSILLLIVNLILIQKYEFFGFSSAEVPVRLSFIMVGLWWIGFAQIAFKRLPPDNKQKTTKEIVRKGYREIKRVWQILKGNRNTLAFLAAFFCYNAGVQTVLYLASIFADKVLGFQTSDLIVLILLLQVLGIFGAYVFARFSAFKGNKISILIMLLIWIAICIVGSKLTGNTAFYTLAGFVGLVMGGIQSLSRSTYAKLFPENTKDTTSFYSFYDVLDKISTVSGTFVFGLVEMLTGDIRLSLLSLAVFFIFGILIMLNVRVQRMSVL